MIGYALSGGNTKGGIQIGQMKRLFELKKHPEVLVGTSVGAINACLIAWHGIEGATELWKSLKSESEIFELNWKQILKFKIPRGLYNLNPLKKKLAPLISGPKKYPNMRVFVTTVSYKDKSIKYFESNDINFLDAVIASSSEPGFMDPIEINGINYMDGGAREYVPVNKVISLGAKEVYALITEPPHKPKKWQTGNLFTNAFRGISTMGDEVFRGDIEFKKHKDITLRVFRPQTIPIDRFDLTPEKVEQSIKIGYESVKL